jgi:hypothetical protein
MTGREGAGRQRARCRLSIRRDDEQTELDHIGAMRPAAMRGKLNFSGFHP